MSDVRASLQGLIARYRPGVLDRPRTYYFSIGDFKYTLRCTPDACALEEGKTVDQADCILKTTPELFEQLVFKGKRPGAWDIARGRFKTNDVAALTQLKDLFGVQA